MANPRSYDVAIIGGGPAGAAAALSLKQIRPALDIGLIEASSYDVWRAGETLPPGSQQILESLGCWDRFRSENFIEAYGTRAVWGSEVAHENEFLFSMHGSGWHLDRRRFDALLCECARTAGVDVFLQSRLGTSERIDEREWRIAIKCLEGIHEFKTAFIIDATGRSASFAIQQGARRIVDDHLTGVSVIFSFPCGNAPADTYTLIEAQEHGWWYSAVLPEGRLVVAWMSDADLVRSHGLHDSARWMAHLRESSHTQSRVTAGHAEASPAIWTAQSQHLTQVTGPGWIAAGDAASTFDPLSSAGILKGLRSGKIASFVALDALDGRDTRSRYEDVITREYEQYQETKARFYAQERRWPESRFWSRR